MRFCPDAGHAGSRRLQAAAASPPHETALLLLLSGPSHRTLIAAARLLLEATSSQQALRTEAMGLAQLWRGRIPRTIFWFLKVSKCSLLYVLGW